MKYPTLTELNASREMIDVFRGYNHNLRIGEGEFYDMTNLTSADYPVLSPRPKRGIYESPTKPLGMISKDGFCYVDGSDFYINKKKVDELEPLNNSPKTLISMGAYVIIMPDKVYVNTENYDDNGKIEGEFIATSGIAKFTLCKLDGTEYKNTDAKGNVVEVPATPSAPGSPKNLDYWIDTSSTPHTLKQYAATTAQWTSVPTTYIKITFPNTTIDLRNQFSANDGVTISGITLNGLEDLNNTMVVWEVGTNYIVVIGILDEVRDQPITSDKPITIERRMPEMDFIIESGNRLWGCKYGLSRDKKIVNEIYASKLGDFKNWHCYAGISTDSYAATVGTDGKFTGAITHLGYPLFFKENCIHKVYGNYPANYQIQTIACRGVQDGCSKSLAIVNEVLYYKSRSAICAYDGSLPVEMSSALGDITYSNAVAGVLGNKYYISMQDASKDYHLFAYDTQKGMWHREDNTQVSDFCNCLGNLYYIDYEYNQIKTIVHGTESDLDEGSVEWEAVTGLIGTDSPDKKYISRLVVRLSLEVGTAISFSIEYDSSGSWEHLFSMTGTSLRSFPMPIRPRRCDHLRLKIEGKGNAKIYSICKTIEQGSDV